MNVLRFDALDTRVRNRRYLWYHVNSAIRSAIDAIFSHSTEPYIHRLHTDGAERWHLYDPLTRRRHVFDTEHDVRVWLEERYRQ